VGLLGYLPGIALGLGLWLGLRWPGRAVKLAALLALVIALFLAVLAGMPEYAPMFRENQGRLAWSVIPSVVAFLLALGFGHLLRRQGGGGME
jgi:peptidoglycan/LPS O-acetylase OafA/YrhL